MLKHTNAIYDALPKTTECTGCGMCQNICPFDAIKLIYDEDGFLQVQINHEQCVQCKKCVTACPRNQSISKNQFKPICLAAWPKDTSIRAESSTAGIFMILANAILVEKGYVCGAAYMEDFSVAHTLVSDVQDLYKLKGSKYVQSKIHYIFREIKALLDAGKKVLFSGLPCQVSGLYHFLEKSYENLITVDLLCHGVPSQKAYQEYLKEVSDKREVQDINFRDKSMFGWTSSSVIRFKDGSIYKSNAIKDPYYRAFLPLLSVRKACSTCAFSHMPRYADISIGDFWRISEYDKSLNDGKGTELVLLNNSKGKQLWKELNAQWAMQKKVKLKYAIKGNPTLQQPFASHLARERFFRELGTRPFSKIVEDCTNDKYDVGIVGLWYGLNYGSILTAYALYKVIESMKLSPLMLQKPQELWNETYASTDSIAAKFILPRCNLSKTYNPYYKWEDINEKCDSFVVGSDVVWNRQICDYEYFFFLDFVNTQKKKISFASSWGGVFQDTQKERNIIEYYLKRFDAVSVREKEAVRICKKTFGIEAQRVLDPVFLCERSVYEKDIKKSKVKKSSAFLFAYILGASKIKRNIILQSSKYLNLKPRIVLNPNNYELAVDRFRSSKVLETPSVEDWLYYLKNCTYFIGDSFHGLCFAIIFEKQFLIVLNKDTPSENRFTSLLSMLNLSDRLVYIDCDKEVIRQKITEKIDYEKVSLRLEKQKKKTRKWLRTVLFKEKDELSSLTTLENHFYMKINKRLERLEDKCFNKQ